MITVYGIKQCDTCRKALRWLGEESVEHEFHDLRTDGLDADRVGRWLASPFAGQLVNRRSTTWRTLSEAEKTSVGEALTALLLQHPTLIKRPVFTANDGIIAIGFDAPRLLAALGRQA